VSGADREGQPHPTASRAGIPALIFGAGFPAAVEGVVTSAFGPTGISRAPCAWIMAHVGLSLRCLRDRDGIVRSHSLRAGISRPGLVQAWDPLPHRGNRLPPGKAARRAAGLPGRRLERRQHLIGHRVGGRHGEARLARRGLADGGETLERPPGIRRQAAWRRYVSPLARTSGV
jgi:hypothetical protein